MLRPIVAALSLSLALAGGCNKETNTGPTVVPGPSKTIEDQGATFDMEIGWRSVGADEVEIVVELIAKGIEQTDSLVVDVSTHGFVISEGGAQWTGFVQPRERYKHTVQYKLLDGADSGQANVTLRRSMDGTLLWDAELLFRIEGGKVVLAQ